MAESIWPKVVLFGDSLTQRSFEIQNGLWGALLADRLQRIADVIPRGFSGYNSRMCKAILPRIFTSKNTNDIKVFVICLGANDSNAAESVTKQHVPLDEFKGNIESMLQYLQNTGVSKREFVLMTPPPYNYAAHVTHCKDTGRSLPVKDNRMVSKYAEAVMKLGQDMEIECVDLYTEMMKDQNWHRYLVDGLHFSHAGATKVYTLLWPSIEKRLQTHNTLFPGYSDVDMDNIESSLGDIF